MENAENVLPPSKKRAAGRELSRDNPGLDDDDETTVQETGTFKKASEEVMANRRIVKVRRHVPSSTPAPSSNPFAGIRLVPPTPTLVSTDKAEGVKFEKVEETHAVSMESREVKGDGVSPVESGPNGNKESEVGKADKSKEVETGICVAKDEVNKEVEVVKSDLDKETEGEKTDVDNGKQSENQIKDADAADSTVHKNNTENVPEKLESNEKSEEADNNEGKNKSGKDTEGEKTENEDEKANTGNPSFSSFQQLSSTPNAFTGLAGTGFSGSTFSFGNIPKEAKTDQPLFSFGAPSNNNGNNTSLFSGSGFPPMQEVTVATGEENEDPVFIADSSLFEFVGGGWKERGKGEIKVNVSINESRKARLVMRSRGNCRLILNANLFPEMKLTNMDKKGITFACINSACETQNKLVTYALKFKDASILEDFRAAVMEHKGHPASTLKTPENSPDASEV